MNETAASLRPLYENTKKVRAPMAARREYRNGMSGMDGRPPGSDLRIEHTQYALRVEGGETGSPDLLSVFVYSFHSYPQTLRLCASFKSFLSSNVFA